MDCTRLAIILFILAGAVLPVLGVALALVGARRTLAQHEVDAKESDALNEEWQEAGRAFREANPGGNDTPLNLEYHKRFADRGLLVPSGDTANKNVTGDLAVTRTLRLLGHGQGWNAAIIILGVVCSTVAAVWSLWLPPA